ncbi:MAG: hypothetical protein Q8S84_05985 [bacterium]|nr:hypothetical protein [bacterium]MDP3381029.1 hypothetical protein [bacterium]
MVLNAQLEFAVILVQHTLIVAQFALAPNVPETVYEFILHVHAILVTFVVKFNGQFVVVLHVYQVLEAVILLQVAQ